MKIFHDVQSTVAPQAVVIDDYSVWVADEVRNTDGCYTYTLTQYEKDEYIRLMDEQSQKTQADVAYIAMMTEVELE